MRTTLPAGSADKPAQREESVGPLLQFKVRYANCWVSAPACTHANGLNTNTELTKMRVSHYWDVVICDGLEWWFFQLCCRLLKGGININVLLQLK